MDYKILTEEQLQEQLQLIMDERIHGKDEVSGSSPDRGSI